MILVPPECSPILLSEFSMTSLEHLEDKATYRLVCQYIPSLSLSVCYVEGDPSVLYRVHEHTNKSQGPVQYWMIQTLLWCLSWEAVYS